MNTVSKCRDVIILAGRHYQTSTRLDEHGSTKRQSQRLGTTHRWLTASTVMAFSLPKSLFARMISSSPLVSQEQAADVYDSSFSHVMNKDLFKQRSKIVDDDHLQDQEPFPLLSGESIEYIGYLYDDHIVVVSNYRLFATSPNGFYSVPLGLIEGVEMQTSKDTVLVICKDARTFRLFFSSIPKCRAWYDRLLDCKKRVNKDTKNIFAFVYRAYIKDEKLKQTRETIDGIPLSVVTEYSVSRDSHESNREGKAQLLSLKSGPSVWREEMMTSEYRRMGMCPAQSEARVWRITQCNDKYELCGTYPKLLVVPSLLSDEELVSAAKFRMSGRLPVVSWRNQTNGCVVVRSSQPLVGFLGWRSPEDEKLLLAFSQLCAVSSLRIDANGVAQNGGSSTCVASGLDNGSARQWGLGSMLHEESDEFFSDSDEEGVPRSELNGNGLPRLKVFDLRSYTVALGNRAKGGGCECTDYYPNCEIFYKGVPNIHSVRKSFQQLRNILSNDDQSNYLSSLENTQWFSYLCQLLSVACEVVDVVDHKYSPNPVLVHCSDGWDRTTQVITLAELMLDPYYRTIQGFKVLIEREWVGFGHRFSDRCGHALEDMNQRSPIFLQWLDCVFQLLRQHPCDFQFNENFLVKLGQHSYSCMFGTFLCNSIQDREENRIAEDTSPVWSLLHEQNIAVVNLLYNQESKGRVLRPISQIKYMLLWKEMYTHPLLTPYYTTTDTTTNECDVVAPAAETHLTQPVLVPRSSVPLSEYESSLSPSPTMESSTNSLKTRENEKLTNSQQHSSQTVVQENKPQSSVARSFSEAEVDYKTTNSAVVKMSPGDGSQLSDEVTSHSSPYDGLDNVASENQSRRSNGTINSLTDSTTLHGECGERHELLHGLPHSQVGVGKNETVGPTHKLLGGETSIELKENGHVVSVVGSSDLSDTRKVLLQRNQFQFFPKNGNNISASPDLNSSPQSKDWVITTEQTRNQRSLKLLANTPTKCDSGDLSPHAVTLLCTDESNDVQYSKTAISLRLDVDGLPLTSSKVQEQVRWLLVERQREVNKLRLQLKEVQLLAHKQGVSDGTAVRGVGGAYVDGDNVRDEKMVNALDDQSPSSLSSWDCVDNEEGVSVRWIPDHAVSHCQGCGTEFWTGCRKHHCRSCGGLFCGKCSNFSCPVKHQQLFDEVRVCEKCFYKLDGHLRTRHSSKVAPT